MRRLIGTKALVVSAVVLLGAAAAAVDLAGRAPAPQQAAVSTPSFRVTSRVTGLYPGRTKLMRVRVRNLQPFAIRVKRLRATVDDASATCEGSTLVIGRIRATRPVPAKRTLTLRVPVTMTSDTPDACIGARYPIRFSGTAVRA